MDVVEMKTCKRCQKQKPVSDYYASPRMRDGLFAKCKQCESELAKARRVPRPKVDQSKNEVGNKHGRLLVVSRAARLDGRAYWNCLCDCGTECVVWGNALRNGRRKSCGCLKKSNPSRMRHGLAGTRICSLWHAMIARCHKPETGAYKWYGARGIVVCERWRSSLNAFVEDMGMPPSPLHSIERKDNNGNYEPANCCWATMSEQNRNNRRTRLVTIDGRTMCLKDWAAEMKLNYVGLFRKMRAGMTPEQALGVA